MVSTNAFHILMSTGLWGPPDWHCPAEGWGDLSMALTTTPSSSLLSLQVAPSAALALSQHQKRGPVSHLCSPVCSEARLTYKRQSHTVPLKMRQHGTGAIFFIGAKLLRVSNPQHLPYHSKSWACWASRNSGAKLSRGLVALFRCDPKEEGHAH